MSGLARGLIIHDRMFLFSRHEYFEYCFFRQATQMYSECNVPYTNTSTYKKLKISRHECLFNYGQNWYKCYVSWHVFLVYVRNVTFRDSRHGCKPKHRKPKRFFRLGGRIMAVPTQEPQKKLKIVNKKLINLSLS